MRTTKYVLMKHRNQQNTLLMFSGIDVSYLLYIQVMRENYSTSGAFDNCPFDDDSNSKSLYAMVWPSRVKLIIPS